MRNERRETWENARVEYVWLDFYDNSILHAKWVLDQLFHDFPFHDMSSAAHFLVTADSEITTKTKTDVPLNDNRTAVTPWIIAYEYFERKLSFHFIYAACFVVGYRYFTEQRREMWYVESCSLNSWIQLGSSYPWIYHCCRRLNVISICLGSHLQMWWQLNEYVIISPLQ